MLANKVAVITGASSGIGLATASAFAELKATVILSGRDGQKLEIARENILKGNPEAVLSIQVCDVSDANDVNRLFTNVYKERKRLDILVANAGVLTNSLISMTSAESVERIFETNTFGVIYCNQMASRLMSKCGGGAIINVASIVGRFGNSGQVAYSSSKAAVIGITQSLAKELAAQNIRVNAVAPGFIETPMTNDLPPNIREKLMNSIGMKRIGTPEEVADVIAFLASDMARYVTGQIIGVDGGMVI